MSQHPANSSETKDIPAIPPGLIDALERRFPAKCPDVTDSERDIFYYAGQVGLIRWLRNVQSRRQQDSSPFSTKETITHV